MNILFFDPVRLFNGNTGDSIHVRELVCNLSRLGHRVAVICCTSKPVTDTTVEIIPTKSFNFRGGGLLGIIWALVVGFIVAKRRHVDLVYVRGSKSFCGLILSTLCRRPLVIEVNGIITDELRISGKFQRDLIPRTSAWLNETSYKYGKHIIAVSPGIEAVLKDDFGVDPERVSVILNGVNADLYVPKHTQIARNELGLSKEHMYLCFVGHLVAWQGVDYLINCSPLVIERCPEAHFIVVGDGPLEEDFKRLAEQIGVIDNFTFTGAIQYERVPLYISASDVCVVPKKPMRSGYSPLKLYNYMACAKPVIATKTEGFAALDEYSCGLLVNPSILEELAAAIVRLFQDTELRKQMGENGRRYVVDNHSWQSVAKRVAEVCEIAVRR
ncbi:MAG: glycosyltransferase family 4 protein [Chloroflexota bacterium]|nr:glycosyltransferase family 4 protein [Chloroflexota bacterium]